MDAVLFEESSVVCMSNQVEVKNILGLDEPDENVLADFTQSIDHEVVCVDHQSQEVSESLFNLAELIGVQVLYDCDEVFSRDSSHLHLSNSMLLIDCLAALAGILVVLDDAQIGSGTFSKAVFGVEHDLEVLASSKENSTVGFNEVFSIKFEHHIEEIVQVATLSHLSHHLGVLFIDSVFRRLDY